MRTVNDWEVKARTCVGKKEMARPRSTGPLHALPNCELRLSLAVNQPLVAWARPKLHGPGPTPGHGAGFWSWKQVAGPVRHGFYSNKRLLRCGPSWLAAYPPGLSVFNGRYTLAFGRVSCKRPRSTKSNDSWCFQTSSYILFIYLYICQCFTFLTLFMHMQLHPNGKSSSELCNLCYDKYNRLFCSASNSSTRYSTEPTSVTPDRQIGRL